MRRVPRRAVDVSRWLTLSLVVLAACAGISAGGRRPSDRAHDAPYLGQRPPGRTAELFAPGIVSTGHSEHLVFFTPDGMEVYYRILGVPHSVIVHGSRDESGEIRLRVAPFSERYGGKCALSPDGSTVLWGSRRPLNGDGAPDTVNHLWSIRRAGDGWGPPRDLGRRFDGIVSATISRAGNIYLCARRPDGVGLNDLYVSRFVDGEYAEPVNLGEPVNSEHWDTDPFISPDESYLLFHSDRPGGHGGSDLYVCYRREDGTWTAPVNLGDGINSSSEDGCATVTPDGRYLFFGSTRSVHPEPWREALTYEQKMRALDAPGNGSEDIYWVSARIIEELRPTDPPRAPVSRPAAR